MSVSIVIATFGDEAWSELAWSRAYPSASVVAQKTRGCTVEVDVRHYLDGSAASARNSAASYAHENWLCFLDADDELCDGYLDAMQAAMNLHLIRCRNEDYERPTWVPALFAPALCRPGGVPAIPNRGKWPATNECCIGTMIPRALFNEIGGFRECSDDGTPLTMYEDYDLFLRAYDAGARIVHVPDAVYCAHGEQRNVAGNWQVVYDAIWADHEKRVAVPA